MSWNRTIARFLLFRDFLTAAVLICLLSVWGALFLFLVFSLWAGIQPGGATTGGFWVPLLVPLGALTALALLLLHFRTLGLRRTLRQGTRHSARIVAADEVDGVLFFRLRISQPGGEIEIGRLAFATRRIKTLARGSSLSVRVPPESPRKAAVPALLGIDDEP